MDKKELWTNYIWEQNSTDEEQREIYEILVRFNRIIEDLNFINDADYICNTLENSQNVRSRYKRFIEECGDFAYLSESFGLMRNMLFSENTDREKIQLMLKC